MNNMALPFLIFPPANSLLPKATGNMPINYCKVSNRPKLYFNGTSKKSLKNILAVKFIPIHWMNGYLIPPMLTDILLKHFQTHSLKGFGVDDLKNGLTAAGAIIHYLKDTEHPNLAAYYCAAAYRPG